MREIFYFLSVIWVFVGVVTSPCVAQRPSGPQTLEGLLEAADEPQASGTTERKSTDKAPAPSSGRIFRPKDGVQHPELDKAWAAYDAAAAKAAEGIRAAISKQFDSATAKGDLDAAEKWQQALEGFEKTGDLPTGTDTKSAANSAGADYKRAKEELLKAYESVVKSLTVEKNLTEARATRDEAKSLIEMPMQTSRVATTLKPSPAVTKQEIRGFRVMPADIPDQCVAALANGVRLVGINESDDNALFKIVPGLADPQGVSFESLARPGHFLRHAGFRFHLHAFANEDLFRKDATFHLQKRTPDAKAVSLRSHNFPSHLVRHRNGELWIAEGNDQAYFQQTAFRLVPFREAAHDSEKPPRALPQSKGDRDRIRVIAAQYGVPGRLHDVTQLVAQCVFDNAIVASCSNADFGDPAPGVRKQLVVRYSDGASEEKQVACAEGDPPIVIHTKRPCPNQGFRVMSAVYGAGVRWKDVTDIVRTHQTSDGLALPRVSNGAMQGDPAHGAVKALVVFFCVDGQEQYAVFSEYAPAMLP